MAVYYIPYLLLKCYYLILLYTTVIFARSIYHLLLLYLCIEFIIHYMGGGVMYLVYITGVLIHFIYFLLLVY